MTPLLSVAGLAVRFGEVEALRGVTFALEAGTLTGLIGPNGAGKTTLLDAVSGHVAASGQVRLGEVAVGAEAPHRRARRGLARTFQSLELFDELTVAENLRLAAEGAGRDALDADKAVQLVGLAVDLARPAGELGEADRKIVALARAAAARPRVLLADEPGAGLDPRARERLAGVLRAIAEDGAAVLLVDHDADLVLATCDRVLVLDLGRLVADGTPTSVRDDPHVVSAYLGSTQPSDRAATTVAPPLPGEPRIAVQGLTVGYGSGPAVRGVDLDVAAGEIVALLGPNGAGKSSTLLGLTGAVPGTRGAGSVVGLPIGASSHRLARRGVAHVTQRGGVFAGLTAKENLRLVRRGDGDVAAAVERFPRLQPLLDRRAGALSGGEQQLLAVARALIGPPAVLLVDELSLGLAPRIVGELLEAIAELAHEHGTAVLFAEQHVDLALQFASRVYVLARGAVVDQGAAADFRSDPDRLRTAYLGRN
jgi:branched-chain amino acid transport system ATP-binding protein